MLIPEKLNTIIRILLANSFGKGPNLTVPIVAKKAKITSAMAKRLVLRLQKAGYVDIRRGIKVIKPMKLLRAWGYCYSIREVERLEFIAAERPQYVMLKIANSARISGLNYASTLFSATEYVSPYVDPSGTYLYVLKKDLKSWQELLKKENIIPAEKEGNVVLLIVDDDYFEGVWEARGVKVVSLPQLYADLFSYGGRGEEAAEELMSRVLKNV